MSKFDTEKVIYPCREQSTEDLLFDADMHWHNGERKDAADVLFNVLCDAIRNNDQKLIDECLKRQSEMRNQFCSFIPSYTASEATDNHNRPTEPPGPKIPDSLLNVEDKGEEEWDDTYDYIFDEKVKPSEIKKAMERIKYPTKISQRRFFYVTYRILDVIKYFSDKITPSDFLRWINLHFNCGWIDDNKHRKQFVFALEDSSKNLEDQHPSDWDEKTIRGGSGKQHHQLAVKLKNTFTETIVNGIAIDDSDSFEHLRDRGQFLKNAYHVKGNEYYIPDEVYINNGE